MKIKNIVDLLIGEMHLGSPGNKYAVVLNNKLMRNNVQIAFRKHILHDLEGWRSFSTIKNKIWVNVNKETVKRKNELTFSFHSADDLEGEDVKCDRVFMDVLSSQEVLPWKLETDDMILLR